MGGTRQQVAAAVAAAPAAGYMTGCRRAGAWGGGKAGTTSGGLALSNTHPQAPNHQPLNLARLHEYKGVEHEGVVL